MSNIILKVELAKNGADPMSVLTHPEIYDCISSDNAPPASEWTPGDAHYLCGYLGDLCIATMVFHPKNSVSWQCHIQVLPEFRRNSDEFATKALEWWFNRANLMLVAEIPSLYPNVIYFGLKHGFKIDGRVDNAYMKNGNLHSIYYLSKGLPDVLG